MASFGNLFTTIGRLLPNYVEGREKAITANWQDQKNYNDVLKGQIGNLWDEATFGYGLQNVANKAYENDMATQLSALEAARRFRRLPGDIASDATYNGAAMAGMGLPEGWEIDQNWLKRNGGGFPQNMSPLQGSVWAGANGWPGMYGGAPYGFAGWPGYGYGYGYGGNGGRSTQSESLGLGGLAQGR